MCWVGVCGGPGDGVDREPGRGGDGGGGCPGEGLDVAVEVGLVGVAGFCGYQGGAVTGGEAVGGVVEADELGGAFGGEADLGPEPGPQSLAAPPGLGCQLPDPDLSLVCHHLTPGESDLRGGR